MSYLDNSFNRPELVWVIEPENKIRFRYESEGGSHGGLAGKLGKKTYPTLKLINYNGRKQISVRVSLYTEDKNEHVLTFKGKKHCIEEKLQDDNTVEFKHLQIISKKKDEIEEILMEQRLNNLKDDISSAVRAHFEKTYRKDVKAKARAILNSVRLYFEAFERNKPEVILCSLFSDVICNQKAAAKGDLRICRLSHVAGSWKGEEEVILLCEKVQKENINVKFYEVDQHGSIIWQEYGHFSPADVHYQYAIPFKTPRYRMNEEKTVFICLERNGEVSEPREFTYKPDRTVPSLKKRKLNNYQSETVSSPEITESSESVSPMNISSPESDSNVEIQSASNSQSDDSNQLGGGMEFNGEDFATIHYLINNVIKDEDYQLPFDELNILEDNFYSNIDGSCSSLTDVSMLQATADMCVSDIPVGQMADQISMNKDCRKNQNLDFFDMDVAFRNFTLKDESQTESKSGFKNCYLNKLLQNGCKSKNLKTSEISLNQKKQIFCSLLLRRDKFDNTILHNAIFMNKNIVPILKMSLIAQADIINLQNHKNQTPLHLATERNKIKEVQILLRCGGNPNLKDDVGNNCYHIAAQNNFFHILQEINRFSHFLHDVSDFNDQGLTPMHISIMQNNSELLFDWLKNHIKNSNIVEKKAGKSLLHYAVYFQPSVLSKLLELEDIDVDIQDFEGNTPLHIACATENIEAVKQLLQSGADHSIKNFKQNYDIESSEDDAFDGQLPAELTANIEILKLLRTSTETEVEDPLDRRNSDTSAGSVEIPSHIMVKLCKYLDDEMKWKKLVTYFFDDPVVVDSLNLSPSPTKALLDYIKKQEQDAYLERFKTVLEFAQLTDALNIINLQHY